MSQRREMKIKARGGKYRKRKQRGQGTHEVEVFLTSGKQPANAAVCVSCLSTFILNTAKIYIKNWLNMVVCRNPSTHDTEIGGWLKD